MPPNQAKRAKSGKDGYQAVTRAVTASQRLCNHPARRSFHLSRQCPSPQHLDQDRETPMPHPRVIHRGLAAASTLGVLVTLGAAAAPSASASVATSSWGATATLATSLQ